MPPKLQKIRNGKFATMDDQALIQAIQQRLDEVNDTNIKAQVAEGKAFKLGSELTKANRKVNDLNAAVKRAKSTINHMTKDAEDGKAARIEASGLRDRITELEFLLKHAKKDAEWAVQEATKQRNGRHLELEQQYQVALTAMEEKTECRIEDIKRGLVKELHDGRAKQREDAQAEAVAQHQIALAEVEEKTKRRIENMRLGLTKQLRDGRAKHRDDVQAEMIAKHSEETQQLKNEHAAAIEQLKSEHKAELETTEIIRGEMHAAGFEEGRAWEGARVAELREENLAAQPIVKESIEAAETASPSPQVVCNSGQSVVQQQAQLHEMDRQLRERDEEIASLKQELQEEKRAYITIQQTAQAQILDCRTVSTDLLHSYLKKEQRSKVPTIHLRHHEWVLSEIGYLPSNTNQRESIDSGRLQAGAAAEDAQQDTPASPAPSSDVLIVRVPKRLDGEAAAKNADPHMAGLSAKGGPGMVAPSKQGNRHRVGSPKNKNSAGPQDPRGRKPRKPVCSRCWEEREECTGDVQCRQCEVAGQECTYKSCIFGVECWKPWCNSVHPNEVVVDGRWRRIDAEGDTTRRKRQRQN